MLISFILFLLWLIGWFVSYSLLSRALIIDVGIKSWDNTDRKFCAAVSLSSWAGAIIALVILSWFKIVILSWFKIKVHLDPMDLSNSFMNFLKKLEPK